MVTPIDDLFPGLRATGYQVTSQRDDRYNCIAWAAGRAHIASWWWPLGDPRKTYWPKGVVRQETVPAVQQLFESLGCTASPDDMPESGYEKIAFFADDQGLPLHAARQLTTGRWTSKLGALEDIEHALYDLVGTEYGSVVLITKRPVTAGPDGNVPHQT